MIDLGGLALAAAFGLWITGVVYWTCLLILWGILHRRREWLEVSGVLSAVAAFSVGYWALQLDQGRRYSGEIAFSLAAGSALWALATIGSVHLFRRLFPQRTVRL